MRQIRSLAAAVLLLAFADPVLAADSQESCAAIANADARLACYDRISTPSEPRVEGPSPAPTEMPVPTAVPLPKEDLKEQPLPPSVVRKVVPPEPRFEKEEPNPNSRDTNQDDQEPEFGITLFGRHKSDKDERFSLQSHIEKAYKNNAGMWVMNLSNGQVWMERERSRRAVESGQDIVIVKRRWDYSMELLGQNRRITVQRID